MFRCSAALVAIAVLGTAVSGVHGVTVMPWMCLERCNGTAASIAANIQQLKTRPLLNAVSFEMFNLGPNATLVRNNLTNPIPLLAGVDITKIAMISSYPYPPDFIVWMRQLFAAPDAWIAHCVATAKQLGFHGYNVDFEPVQSQSHPITAHDAAAYADFLTRFGDALHAAGLVLSADVATWSPLWNLTQLASTHVDWLATMSTYTDNFASFQAHLQQAVTTVPPHRLMVGLETVRASDGKPYTSAELAERFKLLVAANVTQLGLWKMPVPDMWFTELDAWANAV